jgi:hypothetical protein
MTRSAKAGIALVPLLLVAAGVGFLRGRRAAPAAPRGATFDVEGAFIYTRVTKTPAPVPARFAAPLPASVEAFRAWSDAHPPRVMVHDGLCRGDEDLWKRYLVALRQAAAAGERPADLRETFGELLRHCERPASCGVVERALAAQEPLPVRQTLYAGIVDCPGDLRPVFERPDAPGWAAVDWALRQDDDARSYWPRLESAVRDALAGGNEFEVRQASMALGAVDDPRAAQALLELHSEARTGEYRIAVAMGLWKQSEPAAKAVMAAACAGRRDPVCSSGPEPVFPGYKPPPADFTTDVDGFVRDWPQEALDAATRRPDQRAALAAALERFLVAGGTQRDEGKLESALRALATLDRPRAVNAASALRERSGEGALSELVRTLVRFPKAEDLRARLLQLQLLTASAAPVSDERAARPAILARDILEQHGRVLTFDTETGQVPNDHDGLLARLADLAGGELEGARFEEIAPPLEDDDEASMPYRLRAYLGGVRYEVEARNLGDWYDVAAVIGLLNAIARDQAAAARFVTLPTGDQTAAVLAAPEDAIRRALDEGLLSVAGADAAMDQGKGFEEEVMRKIRSGELKLGQ